MTGRRRAAALAALVVVSVAAYGVASAPGVAVAGGGATSGVATDDAGPGDAGGVAPAVGAAVGGPAVAPAAAQSDPSATFEETIVVTDRGSVATLTVVLAGTDEATLSVGGPSVNYVLNATVRDGDDDGRVAVAFDTGAAGLAEPTVSTVAGADSVTVTRETGLQRSIEPAEYPLSLLVGGVRTGVGTLVVRPAGTPTPETPLPTAGPELGLDPSVVTLARDGTADFAAVFDDSRTTTLTVTDPNGSYSLRATLQDGDGDGRVRLALDAASAGVAGDPLSARDDADSVTVTDETALGETLPPGEYDLRLRSGAGATDPAVATGRLVVEPSSEVGTASVSVDDTSLPADPAIVVLAGVAVVGLAVAAGSRLLAE